MELEKALSRIPNAIAVFVLFDSKVKISRESLIDRRKYDESTGANNDWSVSKGADTWMLVRGSNVIAYTLPNKYPEHLVRNVRYNIGIEEDETDFSKDFEIQTMSEYEFFSCICSYKGIGSAYSIIGYINQIWGINLQ